MDAPGGSADCGGLTVDGFARETAAIRAEVFQETAARMGVQPAIIEKDCWVCWTIKRAFSLGDRVPGLIFKGGTSLSKAYGLIRRFSEDIDLSLDRHDLGFTGERDPANATSNKTRKALLDELEACAIEAVGGSVKAALSEAMSEALGEPVLLETSDDDRQTLIFTYPESLPATAALPYVRSSVRLEFGARSDHLPAEQRDIFPFVHEQFPDLFSEPGVSVKTLSAARTFWEKATILHMLAHRDAARPLGERMSRHYYDLAQLARSRTRPQALSDLALLEAVALHKSVFFRAAWANYETARPPTLRLAPAPALAAALRSDYMQMAEMLFDAPEPFDAILETIAALEADINSIEAPPNNIA